MRRKGLAIGSIVTFIATGGGIVYFFGGVKEARQTGQGIVRFTRTALTVSISSSKMVQNLETLIANLLITCTKIPSLFVTNLYIYTRWCFEKL